MKHRIIIAGDSCSGKTTMGAKISQQTGIPHLDLDEIHWLENWTEKEPALFRKELSDFVQQHEQWVITGGYTSMSKDISWPVATTIIWLHYPLHKVLRRFFIRTTNRVITRKKVCGNNYETFRNSFLSRDNLFFWILNNREKKRKRFTKWRTHDFKDKTWIEINSNRDYQAFFEGLIR